jgi:hypothetical protein
MPIDAVHGIDPMVATVAGLLAEGAVALVAVTNDSGAQTELITQLQTALDTRIIIERPRVSRPSG